MRSSISRPVAFQCMPDDYLPKLRQHLHVMQANIDLQFLQLSAQVSSEATLPCGPRLRQGNLPFLDREMPWWDDIDARPGVGVSTYTSR